MNNDLIYQIWGEDFITESGEIPYISGWRQVILHLPANLPSSSTLTFYAGNSGDNLKPSLIFLDEITTNLILANLDSQVVLQVFSAQSLPETLKINYKYFLDGVAVSGVSDPGEFQTTFSLFSQPDDYQIEYWLSDNFEHRSISTKIPIYLDKTTPVSITDLITHLETENEITLTFTSPEDNFSNPVSDYEVRYSDQIITDLTDWQSLDLLYGQSIAPRFFGQREKLVFETPNAPGLYYLGIKSIDNMGNYSYLSNIITFTKE